jgi:hypothetical protein
MHSVNLSLKMHQNNPFEINNIHTLSELAGSHQHNPDVGDEDAAEAERRRLRGEIPQKVVRAHTPGEVELLPPLQQKESSKVTDLLTRSAEGDAVLGRMVHC